MYNIVYTQNSCCCPPKKLGPFLNLFTRDVLFLIMTGRQSLRLEGREGDKAQDFKKFNDYSLI